MLFCSTDKCALCALIKGSAQCLRRQAQRCMDLAERAMRRGTRDALEELSMELMEDASAADKEHALPAAPAE